MDKSNLHINSQPNASSALRLITMFYSLVCYVIGVAALVYLILFIADLLVPVTINQGAGIAPEIGGFSAVLWNIAVITVWGLQHSIMARPAFKRIWTRIVPVAVERSTYLVFVALATLVLIVFWIPMPALIWDLSDTVLGSILMGTFFLVG